MFETLGLNFERIHFVCVFIGSFVGTQTKNNGRSVKFMRTPKGHQ
jgi:hypothetical protein